MISLQIRNPANTSTVATITDIHLSFQKPRNDLGSIEFTIPHGHDHANKLDKGTIIRPVVDGVAWPPYRLSHPKVTMVSTSDEAIEGTQWSGTLAIGEWQHDLIWPTAGTAVLEGQDRRYFNWQSPDYVDSAWPNANPIAFQGWLSAFYTGAPEGWTDNQAQFLWGASGTDQDAPPGECLFRTIPISVTAGVPYTLDWAADDFGYLWVNGHPLATGDPTPMPGSRTHELIFESSGTVVFAFLVANFAGGGPPGGNPGCLLWSLRTSTGVVARSLPSTTKVLEYPASIPRFSIGQILRRMLTGTNVENSWTIAGTETHDVNSASWPLVDDYSVEIYKASPWDALKQLSETWIDFELAVDGKVLRPANKGTLGSSSALPLVTGYSTAGVANPATVNIDDLIWDRPEPVATALLVRWSNGTFTVGAGQKWQYLDLSWCTNALTAHQLATEYLTAFSSGDIVASFGFIPINSGQRPPIAVDVFDTLAIPGPTNHNTTTSEVVSAITVTSNDNGEPQFVIEAGSLVQDKLALLDQASQRGGSSGTVHGRALSAGTGHRVTREISQPRKAEWGLFATGAEESIGTESPHPANLPTAGRLNNLRMRGNADPATGTTTCHVSINGVNIATLSMSASQTIHTVEGLDRWCVTTDLITVHPVADGGHTGITIQAGVKER